jgi:nitrite reductase/ring-hydroxylating ferredoxin subunit
MFLLGTGTTLAAAYLAACGKEPSAQIAAKEIPVGGAIMIDEVIFAQPQEGVFKAWSRRCTHQNQMITEVEGLTATCTAHFSQYNLEDGTLIQGPARGPLQEYGVRNDGGTVVTTTS